MGGFPQPRGRVRLLLLATLILIPALLIGQQPAPAGCVGPNQHAFDYWVGEWVVADTTGRDIAESSVTLLADGCALLEQWRPKGGQTGTSLNWFERSEMKWHQVWLSGSNPSVLFVGGTTDGTMRMTTLGKDHPGQWARMTWLRREHGVVRQVFENSSDGTNWQASFVGDYRRKP